MKKPQPSPFTQSNAVEPPDQIQGQIRQRAYEIYDLRGREDGHDLDDWLTAESEVLGIPAPKRQGTKSVNGIAMASENEGNVSRSR